MRLEYQKWFFHACWNLRVMMSDPVIAVPAPHWIQKQGFFPSHNRERWLHPSLRICTSPGQHTRADPVVRDGEEATLKTELKFPLCCHLSCCGVDEGKMPTPQYKRACLSWRSHLAPSTAIAQRRADPSPWQGCKFKLTLLSGMQVGQPWRWENRRAYNSSSYDPTPPPSAIQREGLASFLGKTVKWTLCCEEWVSLTWGAWKQESWPYSLLQAA